LKTSFRRPLPPRSRRKKVAKNAHAEIERIKTEYKEAYRARWGEAAADLLSIRYKSGWWFLTASPLSTPYRTKEIVAMIERLRKRTGKP
jgi:hypothetical protein